MSAATIILLVLAGLAYLAALLSLAELRASDAAGNGLTQVAAVFSLAIQWLLLAALAVKEQRWAGLALAVLGALAGALALKLLDDGPFPPKWPLALAVVGPLVVAGSAVRGRGAADAMFTVAALAAVGLGTVAYRASVR